MSVAYAIGNYSIAFKEFKVSAEQGDALAQTMIGGMFTRGVGVKPDNFKAWMKS